MSGNGAEGGNADREAPGGNNAAAGNDANGNDFCGNDFCGNDFGGPSSGSNAESRETAVLRILMADDHPVVLAGMKALVQADPGLRVVGEARDGREALRLARALRPDVVVLDLSMPEPDGVATAKALLEERPGQRVLVMTVHEDRATLRRLLDLGVAGYLLKRSAADELPRALRAAAAGGTYLDPAVAGKLAGTPARGDASRPAGADADLSERETEVLRLIAIGHSNKEIGARLGISVKTIETYKARAMEKLGLRSRVDVVRHAAARGWLSEG